MIFCEDMRTVRIVSTLIGGGDTQILIAIICLNFLPSEAAGMLKHCSHAIILVVLEGGGGLAGSQGVLK